MAIGSPTRDPRDTEPTDDAPDHIDRYGEPCDAMTAEQAHALMASLGECVLCGVKLTPPLSVAREGLCAACTKREAERAAMLRLWLDEMDRKEAK